MREEIAEQVAKHSFIRTEMNRTTFSGSSLIIRKHLLARNKNEIEDHMVSRNTHRVHTQFTQIEFTHTEFTKITVHR